MMHIRALLFLVSTSLLSRSVASYALWQKTAPPVKVRTSLPDDDFGIADLRTTVFNSDIFTYQRGEYIDYRCQMQDFRRSHGATGVVALRKDNGTILGSAECSTQEFQGTRLGDTSDSLLYITSVSVAPTARKQGIASKMIRKIHDIAEARSTESIFLHVDTENETVIRLYEKFGYEIQDKLIHSEFTTSLNLHDDAIPGRKHYLMCKQLV